MGKKEALTAVVDVIDSAIGMVETNVPEEAKNGSGTFERWAAKDFLSHVAAWIELDFARIDALPKPAVTVTRDNIAGLNRKIFEEHAAKDWRETMAYLRRVVAGFRTRIDTLGEDGLNREVPFDDGSSTPVWRMLAGHGAAHLSSHFGEILRRHADASTAARLETMFLEPALAVDEGADWRGTVRYNLACALSQAGRLDDAMSELTAGLELRPELKEYASRDEDLAALAGREDFKAAVGG